VSVFENESLDIRYDYTEALGDGEGLTAGRAGFTTAAGDFLEVVQKYIKINPKSEFVKYIPRLKQLADNTDGSIKGLEGISQVWKDSCKDPAFKKIQDDVVDELYFNPVIDFCKQIGLKTPLSIACLYDTAIQHGIGDDLDSLGAIIKTTQKKYGTLKFDEALWLQLFLTNRKVILSHANNTDIRSTWQESVGRVVVLQGLLIKKNFNLSTPITINPFGTSFTISSQK
jgi:chitosanase